MNESAQTSSAPNLRMRPATPKDAEFILANLEGLAEAEGRPGAVTSTAHEINAALFGNRATAECRVFLNDKQQHVGHAWFFERVPTFSGKRVLCLEDIYICSEHRGRGIGARAMAMLAALALERECCGMLWEVKAGNDAAECFYQRLGAEHNPTILSYEFIGDAFYKLARGTD